MADDILENERLIPVGPPLYSKVSDGGIHKDYYAGCLIHHSSPTYRWKVHIGDIVAISMKDHSKNKDGCLSLEDIEEWQPNHLKKSSSHWKIGLVLAMVQVVENPNTAGHVKYECHVEWLEKALDTPEFVQLKNTSKTFRPYTKPNERSKLPHVLLRSFRHGSVSPANILPVQITMLSDAEFKEGLLWDPIENPEHRFSFQMHCPKFITSYSGDGRAAEFQPDPCMDFWPELNHYSFTKPSNPMALPKPLEDSWVKWHPVQADDELLLALVRGFGNTREGKAQAYRDFKNGQVEQQKRRAQEENLRIEAEERQRQAKLARKGQSNAKRHVESTTTSNNKRVRVSIDGRTPVSGPSCHNTEIKNRVKSILKTSNPREKSQTPKAAKTGPSTKRKEKTAKVAATPLSQPTAVSATPTSTLKMPIIDLSKQQKAMVVTTFGETPIHTGKHKGEQFDFYERVSIKAEREGQERVLMVGLVVAMVKEDVGLGRKELAPLGGPWGVGQILAMYQSKESQQWIVQVRWLLRFVEVSHENQQRLERKKFFDKQQGLLETIDVAISPIQAILPIQVDIGTTARGKWRKKLPPATDYNDLPTIYFQCRYFQDEDGSISLKNDWGDFSEEDATLRGPLARAFNALTLSSRVVKEKYRRSILDRACNMDEDSHSTSVESSFESLAVETLSSKPLFERWGVKFHDGARIAIDTGTLHSNFSPETTQWTIKVGFVIPVAYEAAGTTAQPQKASKKRWFPFICSWSPAQIVSIYQDINSNWKMQIRWFHHYEELTPEQKEGLADLNKPHVVFESEAYSVVDVACCLPGRVILSSSDCEDWYVAKSSISGLPLIPRYCSHICLDDEADECADWTNYDASLASAPKPLLRGLFLDPRNREHKDWIIMLSRRYKKSLSQRSPDPEGDILKRWEGTGLVVQTRKSTTVEFMAAKAGVTMGNPCLEEILEDSKHVFSQSLRLEVPVDYIANPSKATRKARKMTCKLAVGNVVAYHDEEAGECADHIRMKHLKYPWFPFRVRWSCGQITAIYQRGMGDAKEETLVEMRRLYRPTEIPPHLRSLMPSAEDDEHEEIFESDSFRRSITASRLLGPLDLFLGKHEATSAGMSKIKSNALHSCRSRFFYYASKGHFQPIFSMDLAPQAWLRGFVTRGILLSPLLRLSSKLHQMTLSACSEEDTTFDVRGLLGVTACADIGARQEIKVSVGSTQKFFACASLSPQWRLVVGADIFFKKEDWQLSTWDVEIGSMVAVQNDSIIDEERGPAFPFQVPWAPCQIIAIHSNGPTSIEALSFEVAMIQVALPESANAPVLPMLDLAAGIMSRTVKAKHILGPVMLFDDKAQTPLDWDQVPKHVPLAMVGGLKLSFKTIKEVIHSPTDEEDESTPGPIAALLEYLSNAAGQNDSTSMSAASASVGVASEVQQVQIVGGPNFVDVSNLRAFYEEASLLTQKEMFETWLTSGKKCVDDYWRVEPGDVVLIHCDGPKKYPLKCNWGVAEVITMWKEFESRDELEKDVHVNETMNSNGDLKLEIRWLYERSDVAGLTVNEAINEDFNEVFETDDTFILDDATCILAPARLYSDPEIDLVHERLFLNHPVQSFLCRRFWSTNRRSLIPCGDLSGRFARAILYSKVLPPSYTSKKLNEGRPREADSTINGSTALEAHTWKEAMRNVIEKLSLKDASKGAYNRGETLVGREQELAKLLSFFRDAIRGLPGPGGIRSSIFLAGPPGVGKTACIRSAVSRLQTEQSRGNLPSFNFIPLNGMEMRHPFESYVKLLEALTGQKHVGSHEKACQRLEYHFTNPKSLVSNDDRSVTVVLLDEIDYLVTEKQSVLYNFFDWPKRAASIPDGRRLVVVGISNTLNLVEQLMPSVQSRVGSEKVVFKAYGVKDATAILQKKILEASPDHAVFDKDAILLAAKKTSNMSGDIRKAFQICRGAAELLLRKHDEKENTQETVQTVVRVADVHRASRESFDTALVTAVSFSSSFQALLLVSLVSLCRSTGREVGGFDIRDIMTKMEALSGLCGDPQYTPPPAFGETLRLLNCLAELNLVKVKTASSTSISFRSWGGGSGGAWPMTTLADGVDEDTITKGLKTTSHKALVDRCLPSSYR